MPPRAVFTIRAPSFISASSRSPISRTVSGVRGRWIEMKSACTRSASSVGMSSMPISLARSFGTYGSNAITRMPNAVARCVTSAPTRPRPRTPSVLPWSSTPWYLARSHRPDLRSSFAWGTLRACASMSAIVCSAADTMLDCGAFTTITPRRVAVSTSTLSRPMPARAITLRFSPAVMTSEVTSVCERTTSASYGAISWFRSPSASSRRTSTWKSRRRSSSPASDSGSVTRTFMCSLAALGASPVPGGVLLKHALGGGYGRAALHRVAQPLQRHLERGEPAHDVELAVIAEVPDAEDLPAERPLTRRDHHAEVRTDPVADRVGIDPLGRADGRHRPVVLQPLAEQVEAQRLHAVLDRT